MSCLHHFDADDVACALRGEMPDESRRVFDAHVDECNDCKASAHALSHMKQVWRRGLERDDAFAHRAREQRLMSAAVFPKMRGSRWRFAVIGAATGALAMLAWSARRSHELPSASTVASNSASASAVAHVAQPIAPSVSAIPLAPSATPLAPADQRFVALRACTSCAHGTSSSRAIAEGAVLPSGEDVRVAKGAVLVLSWGLDGSGFDRESPGSRVDVDGPAVVAPSASSTGAAGALVLSRGVAHAEARDPRELRTKLATTRADHAAWTLDARGDHTRVDVARGNVHLEASGPRHEIADLAPGDSVNVLADGRIEHLRGTTASNVVTAARASTAHPRLTGDALLWQVSEEALERGDRPAAESALHALLDNGAPSALRERAGARLAQLELARGDRDSARARLTQLIHGRDRAIAADAALLLARSTPSATDRTSVWRDYLRTAPPSPYREQASVEQALSLLDAGDRSGARAIADTLHADPALPEVVRASLARLDARLGP